eukprot:CAMPEP_0116109922 /NCGR_PEP_ID=MMETSP0327-20121206/17604_1 /TAXON_ID=44447 /ORGANISM="Pseudo-nitzschia delicatissima, Strain B596" /LENGTH=532 /DNA_ID=CAMNT_0003602987 /DNA_START=50 /DNA_END=1645 /DNA_ORIENTATION=+
METNHDWNGSMAALQQTSRPATILEGFAKNRAEEDNDGSVSSMPWMKRFVSETGVNASRASTIITQLNNYHRLSSIASKDDPSNESSKAKNEVTPPSGSLKPPWEEYKNTISGHPPDPPPLLLSGVDATLGTSVHKSITDEKQGLLSPKKGVPHVYHDYSNVPDAVAVVRKKTGGVTQPFPEKLHTMLNNDDDPSIVGWLPHGRAFLVRKPSEFTKTIMPKYFRQTKLTSFQRQLNLYGFRRLTQGADSGAYYHELFLRGRPQLCLRMQRQKIKGTGHKQPADVQTEPNFYNMTPANKCNKMNRRESAPVPRVGEKPKKTIFKSPSLADLSPKSRGAANLLTDLKSTFCSMKGRSSVMDPNFSLGQPAMSHQSSTTSLSPASFSSATQSLSNTGNSPSLSSNLYSTEQRSMSLLGRVQQFPKPLKMKTSLVDPSSAFFWPPRKVPISSPSHTAVTFESSATLSPSPTDPYLVQTETMEGTKKPYIIDQRQRSRQRSESSLSQRGAEERSYGGLYQQECHQNTDTRTKFQRKI